MKSCGAVRALYELAPTPETAMSIIHALREYEHEVTAAGACDGTAAEVIRRTVDLAIAAAAKAPVGAIHDDRASIRAALGNQFDLNMELLRDVPRNPRSLAWLQQTNARAGVLGLWGSADKSSINIVGSYERGDHATTLEERREELPTSAFPPAWFLEREFASGEMPLVVPVKSGASDWGWLAAIQPIDTRVLTEREALNQCAAMLTVALDEAAAVEGRKGLEREIRTILENSPDAIARYDLELRYEYVNAAAAGMLGTTPEAMVGRTDRELGRDASLVSLWESALQRAMAVGRSSDIEFQEGGTVEPRWYQAKLVPQFDTDGAVIGVLTSTRDMTIVKRAELALAHQATHDPLTGLANRVLLVDRLSQAIARLEREPGRVAVFFVDLDGFKDINDTFGHGVGDRVLMEVAHRLSHTSRQVDTVSRLGGDEFVMLCVQLLNDDDARVIAERALSALAEPFRDDGRLLSIGASVGVALVTDANTSAMAVIQDADAAMYRAKAHGGGKLHIFESPQRSRPSAGERPGAEPS